MRVFPVFLDLARRSCLVVGGGAVGCDKAAALVAAGAEVLVVDPLPSSSIRSLAAAAPGLLIQARVFRDEDCDGHTLVFACTDDAGVNTAVMQAAAACGVLCCRADAGGDFSTGALLRRGSLCVAVSSGGASPALAVEARDRIATAIGEEFGVAAQMLADLRERLRDDVRDGPARAKALRGDLVAALLKALGDGDDAQATALVEGAFEKARRVGSAATDGREGARCTR